MEIVQGIWAGLLGVAALAPLATFGVVLVAYLAYRQRSWADRRDQWWKRAQWAIDAALDDDDPHRRLAGLKVLIQLIGSDLATAEDADLMSALAVGIRDQEQDGRRSIAVAQPVTEKIVAEAGRLLQAATTRGQHPPTAAG
ncbi:MAG: hypothetical protein ABWY04_19920 [Arthrobacter sp.]